MLTYGQLLKKLQQLNPLELEEEVIVVKQDGRAIFGLVDYRIATNHLIIGSFQDRAPEYLPKYGCSSSQWLG